MSYAQGIDFRGSSGYVTDPANCTYEIGTGLDYPTTTPQGNTVGWESSSVGLNTRDRTTAYDARLAGCMFTSGNGTSSCTYRFDLPSAGSYTINLAATDENFPGTTGKLELFDDTSSLGVLYNISGTYTSGPIDAAGNVWTLANWPANNVAITKTFASTICRFTFTPDAAGDNCAIAHIFVQAAGGTQHNQSVLASCTPAATIVRETSIPVVATGTGTPTIVRYTSIPVVATGTGTPTIVRYTSIPVVATGTATPTIVRETSIPVVATGTGTPTIDEQIVTLQNVLVSTTPTATIVRQTGIGIDATTTGTPTIVRQIAHAIAAACTPAVTLVKSTAISIVQSSAVTATVNATLVVLQSVSAVTGTIVATLGTVYIPYVPVVGVVHRLLTPVLHAVKQHAPWNFLTRRRTY